MFVGVAIGVMGQQHLPHFERTAGLLADLPRGARRIAEAAHHCADLLSDPVGIGGGEAEHRRDQHRCIGSDARLRKRAQDEMPAHRMAYDDMRGGRARQPVSEIGGDIVDPDGEILDMADMRVGRVTARTALPAPIDALDAPAALPPVLEALDIFFNMIAAPADEQDRSARGGIGRAPAYPAQRPAILRSPMIDRGRLRNTASVECRRRG